MVQVSNAADSRSLTRSPRSLILAGALVILVACPASLRADAVVRLKANRKASVRLDGQFVGETPLTLSRVTPGTHTIELSHGTPAQVRTVQVISPKDATIESTVRVTFAAVRTMGPTLPGAAAARSAPATKASAGPVPERHRKRTEKAARTSPKKSPAQRRSRLETLPPQVTQGDDDDQEGRRARAMDVANLLLGVLASMPPDDDYGPFPCSYPVALPVYAPTVIIPRPVPYYPVGPSYGPVFPTRLLSRALFGSGLLGGGRRSGGRRGGRRR